MATYYKWRKSTIKYTTRDTSLGSQKHQFTGVSSHTLYYVNSGDPTPNQKNGTFDLPRSTIIDNDDTSIFTRPAYFSDSEHPTSIIGSSETKGTFTAGRSYQTITLHIASNYSGNLYKRESIASPNSLVGYVYSTSSSAYPNGGVQDGYYYDQRTTVTSPTAPTGLTYPNPITTPTVTVSWDAASSNTDYPVEKYVLAYQRNGSWQSFDPLTATSREVSIPVETTSILFSVRAIDTNGELSSKTIGPTVNVYLAPTLTVPQMVMQGQSATISWSAIEGATSYTLQRKANTDADWTQVYSGTATTFSETVGTWTSVQYRVQAVFSGTPGGWATSDPIQIVSASALVISGQDGDLGTLVNDVQYSISSDQTSPTIDVTVEVNGGEYASFQATSGQSYKVGVLDLPTGTGSIVITASTEVSSSPVSVTRTWTYSKTAQTFPNAGGVAQLTKEGAVIWPKTLDEAVRAAMNPWGGNLGTALNLLKNAALFNRTKQPKYSEVTVSLSGKTEGQTIQLPENGRMVEFYVAKLDYELALNGAGRVLLVRKDCYDLRAWDAGDVNAWASSDLLTWLNGTYKALFPEEVQTAMGTTTYYYTPGNGNNTVTTRSDAVFQASATELGESENWFNVEGSSLPIADQLKIAYLNGSAKPQWTRSPRTTNYTNLAAMLSSTGNVDDNLCSYYDGSRPCFTLPSTFTYGPVYVAQDGTIHASQEYTEAGDWLDVWGNAIPAVKIEAGSYTGTGTAGSRNPNTLTFSFAPKLVVISGTATNQFTDSLALISGNTETGAMGYNNLSSGSGVFAGGIRVSWNKNSVSWYVDDISNSNFSEHIQKNIEGQEYYYVAIG